jgi:hypothetical protein
MADIEQQIPVEETPVNDVEMVENAGDVAGGAGEELG